MVVLMMQTTLAVLVTKHLMIMIDSSHDGATDDGYDYDDDGVGVDDDGNNDD